MRAIRLALLALLAGGAFGCTAYVAAPVPPPPVAAATVEVGDTVEVSAFYDGLSGGEWIERAGYGRVWYPTVVRAGWRPYVYGRWVNSDYGWTWVSEEEFGWATYHYGRWYQDAEVGWVWVPGRQWGPAWVSFHQGGGYIGWAPLPPAAGFVAGVGIQLGGVSIGAGAYTFVEERAFLHPRVGTVIVAPERNVTIINSTTNITNYTVVNNKVVNQSIAVNHIENVTGQKVVKYQIATASTKGASSIQGNQLSIYKPMAQAKATAAMQPTGSGKTSPASPAQGRQQRLGSGTSGQAPQYGQAGESTGANQDGRANGGAQTGATSQGVQGGHAGQGGTRGAQGLQGTQGAHGQGGASQAGGATVNAQELNRRHQEEKQQLAAKHAAEVNQLKATHQQQAAAKGGANAADLRRQHASEMQALRDQHKKEQEAQAARHKQEAQAARGKQSHGKEKKPSGG